MEKLVEIFVQGKMMNLDQIPARELQIHLQSVQAEKERLKSQLDDILEEIYN